MQSLQKTSTLRVQRQAPSVAKPRTVVAPVKAIPTYIAIGGSTIAFLAAGRFIFRPYWKRSFDAAGPSNEMPNFQSSKDPSGFSIAETLGYGALGHAFGYFLLAAASLNDAGVAAFPR